MGASRKLLGGLLGASRSPLGASWGPPGASWGRLAANCGLPQRLGHEFERFGGRLQATLGRHGALFGTFWGPVGLSWASLGLSGCPFGPWWGDFRPLFGGLGSPEDRGTLRKNLKEIYMFYVSGPSEGQFFGGLGAFGRFLDPLGALAGPFVRPLDRSGPVF